MINQELVDNTMSLSTSEIIQKLQLILGNKLLAYIGESDNTAVIKNWVEENFGSVDAVALHTKFAYALITATLLLEVDDKNTVQSWFQGRNSLLDDMAPARYLRAGDFDGDIFSDKIFAATMNFIVMG